MKSQKGKAVFAPNDERTGRSGTLGPNTLGHYVKIEHLNEDGSPIAVASETRLVAEMYVARGQARFV